MYKSKFDKTLTNQGQTFNCLVWLGSFTPLGIVVDESVGVFKYRHSTIIK